MEGGSFHRRAFYLRSTIILWGRPLRPSGPICDERGCVGVFKVDLDGWRKVEGKGKGFGGRDGVPILLFLCERGVFMMLNAEQPVFYYRNMLGRWHRASGPIFCSSTLDITFPFIYPRPVINNPDH